MVAIGDVGMDFGAVTNEAWCKRPRGEDTPATKAPGLPVGMWRCVMTTRSDTLHVILPPGMDLHSATVWMSQFGDVSYLEMVPGDELTIAVVFFSVKAAQLALNSLGPECCWPVAPRGSRSVRIPGSVTLDLESVAGVSGVSVDPEDPGTFVVEFFDERAANSFRESSLESSKPGGGDAGVGTRTVATASTDTAQPGESKPGPVPAYVVPTALVANWGGGVGSAAYASPVREDVTVLVKGLPNKLLTKPFIEVMLQQAGLADTVGGFEVTRGAPCGELLLDCPDHFTAAQIMRHFEGCQWDSSGTGVTASIISAKVDAVHTVSSIANAGEVAKLKVPVAPPPGLSGRAIPEEYEGAKCRTNSTTTESTAEEPSEAEEDDLTEGE